MLQEINSRKSWVDAWSAAKRTADDALAFIELAEDSSDETLRSDIANELYKITVALGDMEFRNMLSGTDDKSNAILTVHSGAGGTESQDWAEMLLRMYSRWCEKNGFKISLAERQDGDGAGIKSATIEIFGDYAF